MKTPSVTINGTEYKIVIVDIELQMPPDPFQWRIVQEYPGHGDLTGLEREVAERLNVEFDALEPGWPLGYKSGDHAWAVAKEMMKLRPELELAATRQSYQDMTQ